MSFETFLAPFVEPVETPEQILALAGFAESQYRLVEVDYWLHSGSRGGPDKTWAEGYPAQAWYARKVEGVWEIAFSPNSPLLKFFKGWEVGDYLGDNRRAYAQAVLIEMGLSIERVEAVKAQLSEIRETAAAEYRLVFGEFVQTLRHLPEWPAFSPEFRAELDKWARSPHGVPVLDTNRLKAQMLEAEKLLALQSSREILVGFEVWHRRYGMTRCGDGWVIQPDGSQRRCDTSTVPRHKYDGTYRWEQVGASELALRWTCAHRGNVAGTSNFEIAKLPVGGCTPEQLATVRQIEEEIGAPIGSFGL